jgi:hypothetical protein
MEVYVVSDADNDVPRIYSSLGLVLKNEIEPEVGEDAEEELDQLLAFCRGSDDMACIGNSDTAFGVTQVWG